MHLIKNKASAVKYLKRLGYKNFELAEHNLSGRNKIFIVNEKDSPPWLLKCNLHTSSEIWFYENCLNYTYKPKIILLDKKQNLIGIKFYSNAKTLLDLSKLSGEKCLKKLALTSICLSNLHNLPLDCDALEANLFLPEIDPVNIEHWQSASPALKRLIYLLQNQITISRIIKKIQAKKPIYSLIHGDLKIDNILFQKRNLLFIDWELCGKGDLRWDIGAILGSMIIIWLESLVINDDDKPSSWTQNAGVKFDDLSKSVNEFLINYLNNINGWVKQQLSLKFIALYTCIWIVIRTWAEASQSVALTRQQLSRLLFIEGFQKNPTLLINPNLFTYA